MCALAFVRYFANNKRPFVFRARPSELITCKRSLAHAFCNDRIVGVVNKYVGVFEQAQLFRAFFFEGGKILLMRLANIGHYADAGLNNGAQSGHFAGLRDTGFKNAQLCLRVEQTNG